MNWHESISGIRPQGPGGVAFGDLREEAAAALSGGIVAPLAHLGAVSASGPDCESFLQGQLSNDVRKLVPTRAQLTSYNSPKGRMLAVMQAFRHEDCYYLEFSASLVEPLLKRLRMFLLRSKATLEDASASMASIGICGPSAAESLEAAGLPAPATPMDCAWQDGRGVIRRHDASSLPRYTVHVPVAEAMQVWSTLAGTLRPVGTAAWRLLEIEAGVPSVHPQTSDRFVAQMCNLDKLGGISFDKGCYTGQEVIARIHYRGAVKRHMVAIDHPDPNLEPGTRLDNPSSAEVVDAAPSPNGGSRALVVSSG